MTAELSTTNTLSTFFDQLAKGQTLKTNSSAGLTQGGDVGPTVDCFSLSPFDWSETS
jgi:hypothetical protein